MQGRILIVDDDRDMCSVLRDDLEQRGYLVRTTTDGQEALQMLADQDVDAMVTDLRMTRVNGIELTGRVRASFPDIPVIVITAFGSMETAIGAIRVGAYDFIPKPFEMEQLVLSLDRAIQHRKLREEVKRLRQALRERSVIEGIVGQSPVMQKLFELIQRAAAADASVLISGESGTGKELVARALHAGSARRDQPFVAVNCAAVPDTLLESELFGHVRGAFTDARTDRKGLFVQAAGGTIFLDEISTLPPTLQPKLLRALQERRVRPVGADQEIGFDVRVISATNVDLETAVQENRFRGDLFYRLNVIRTVVPPLRSRGNDILLLAQHFINCFAPRMNKDVRGLIPEAARMLLAYSWPGNVRELQNCLESAVALTEFDHVTVQDLPERIQRYTPTDWVVIGDDPEDLLSMDEVERRYVLRVLEVVRGNKTLAAQLLGFDRKTLYRKLDKYLSAPEATEECD